MNYEGLKDEIFKIYHFFFVLLKKVTQLSELKKMLNFSNGDKRTSIIHPSSFLLHPLNSPLKH